MKAFFPGSDTRTTQVGDMDPWPVTWPNLSDLIGWGQKNVTNIMIELLVKCVNVYVLAILWLPQVNMVYITPFME